jgi:menaquinone-dependent protoporphyrinogen IX oxidase
MRALILYSTANGAIQNAAQNLSQGLEQNNWQVQMLTTEGSGPINVIPYDLVCVGSPVVGAFGGKVATDVSEAISRCNRLDGKKTIAFVTPKIFGTDKSLRALMGLLESQGANVFDFQAIRSSADAGAVAQRAR